jgi:hypothetical protein
MGRLSAVHPLTPGLGASAGQTAPLSSSRRPHLQSPSTSVHYIEAGVPHMATDSQFSVQAPTSPQTAPPPTHSTKGKRGSCRRPCPVYSVADPRRADSFELEPENWPDAGNRPSLGSAAPPADKPQAVEPASAVSAPAAPASKLRARTLLPKVTVNDLFASTNDPPTMDEK